jgi:hypothetical protein
MLKNKEPDPDEEILRLEREIQEWEKRIDKAE